MTEVKGKQKLSCRPGFENLKAKDIDSFYEDAMAQFGISHKYNITRKINGAILSPIEISAFEEIFAKYEVTENIWINVD